MQPQVYRVLGRLLAPCLLGAALQLQAADLPGPLVETQWLADNLDGVVVLDIRRDPQGFIRKAGGGGEVAGVQACGAKAGGGGVSGHIPGAALIEFKEIAVKEKAGGVELHDTLPTKEAFETLMRARGVDRDSAVVIASPSDNAVSVADGTRLYWTLKYFGHDRVALLNGGVAKWASEKRKIEYGRTKPASGDWQATAERRELVASLDDVQRASTTGDAQILDVRPADYYLGLVRKADKVAAKGHVPGAKNLPFILYMNESGKGSTFYGTDDLKRVSQELGIPTDKPTVVHCNTGHLASSGWFAMHELLGQTQTSLYDGSMNEWAADPARPVSTRLE